MNQTSRDMQALVQRCRLLLIGLLCLTFFLGSPMWGESIASADDAAGEDSREKKAKKRRKNRKNKRKARKKARKKKREQDEKKARKARKSRNKKRKKKQETIDLEVAPDDGVAAGTDSLAGDQPMPELSGDGEAMADDASGDSMELEPDVVSRPAAGSPLLTDASRTRPWYRRFYIRAGVLHFMPLLQSDEVVLSGVEGMATLAVQNGPIPGSRAEVDSLTLPAAIVGWELPWRGFSIETILANPITIEFRAVGTIADESLAPEVLGIPTGVEPLGPDLGSTKALPPVVTAVYRFRYDHAIRPYAGAGMSVLIAYDSKITNEKLTEVTEPEFEIDPAVGVVVQGGVEARFLKRFYVTLDLKFIGLMTSTGTVKNVYMNTPDLPLFETVKVGNAGVKVTVNPLLFHLGAGMTF